jgi:hypothetical protein
VNSVIVVVAAAILTRFESYFSGRRALLIIPMAVSTSAALNALAGWPSWLVINSRMPWLPRQVGGLLTDVLAAWAVSLVVKLLARPADVWVPAGADGRDAAPGVPPAGEPVSSGAVPRSPEAGSSLPDRPAVRA